MITLSCHVNKHEFQINNKTFLTSGSKNIDALQIDFDSSWSGFGKEAVFWYGYSPTTSYRSVISTDGTCNIPSAILNKNGKISCVIRGTKDDKVLVTNAIQIDVKSGIMGG